LQQFRETMQDEQTTRFLIHDRDSIYSADLDLSIEAMGVKILKTPVGAPTANAYCKRLTGTIRRECLDFMIRLNERHLRWILREWAGHYNKARPHSSLGAGIPDSCVAPQAPGPSRHQIACSHRVIATPVLGGLHHEYRLVKAP
jgi:putative transposase